MSPHISEVLATPQPTVSIVEHFALLEDPRLDRKKLHPLEEIMVLAICGVLCGADDWVGIEAFGKEKYD